MAVIPYAKEVGLPMIGPIGGASALFSERLVFPLLPDYGWSAASNLDYALERPQASRVALLWENDELGRSAKRGFDLLHGSAQEAAGRVDPVRGPQHRLHARMCAGWPTPRPMW